MPSSELDLFGFATYNEPFMHWVDEHFLAQPLLREINEQWPPTDDPRWMHERRDYARKSAMMFPRRLPDAAQKLAAMLYSPDFLRSLSRTVDEPLLPDPWFTEGPLVPKVGGGLHEIEPGGYLRMHIDFGVHPSGLERALNLLIYLNEDWRPEWGGALRLGENRLIYPIGGTAVAFKTTDTSWHGHPGPLACPEGRTRRSLALYYYRRTDKPSTRVTTLYAN